MANYDPAFHGIARAGDILVAGRNFGTGSSREQAATCLVHRGIAAVVAASFSETYRRNAFNNGFIVIECPEFTGDLRETLSGVEDATIVGPDIEIDYAASVIREGERKFPFPPLSPTAQTLIAAGGAENLVRGQIL